MTGRLANDELTYTDAGISFEEITGTSMDIASCTNGKGLNFVTKDILGAMFEMFKYGASIGSVVTSTPNCRTAKRGYC